MFTAYSSKYRVVGFGTTQEEADAELTLHIARQDISVPEAKEYAERRVAIYPWNPLVDILHIKNVGAIVHDGSTITNTRTGKTVEVTPKPFTQYLYLYQLLGDFLSFSDFTVCAKREIDKFFKHISPVYTTLEDFPIIQPGLPKDAVSVTNVGGTCFWCTTKISNVILVSDAKRMLSITHPASADLDGIIAYGFAKLGYMYDGKKVTQCQNVLSHSAK